MARKILFTEDALDDLEDILDYIRKDNEAAADSLGEALLNHVELLLDFPLMGTPVRRRRHVRKIVHSPVRIYYRVNHSTDAIGILHFWHGARKDPRS